MTTTLEMLALLPYAMFVVTAIVTSIYILLWVISPIIESKRLKEAPIGLQEQSYEDPNQTTAEGNARISFGSILHEKASLSLSIIVPAYNEESRITETLEDTITYLEKRKQQSTGFTYEIIVVDDGSQDRTVSVVLAFVKKHTVRRIKLLRLKQNHGKGGAVRKGVLRSLGEKILFTDADNATHIRELVKLEAIMDEEHLDGKDGVIVCGSRAHLEKQAIAKRHPLRNILMNGFHFLVSTLCVKEIRDTQCGFKLLDRTAAKLVFIPMHIERWGFDVEILYIAIRHHLTIKEVAVVWREVPGSKLNVATASLSMLREIILIRLCYCIGLWNIHDSFAFLRNRVSKESGP